MDPSVEGTLKETLSPVKPPQEEPVKPKPYTPKVFNAIEAAKCHIRKPRGERSLVWSSGGLKGPLRVSSRAPQRLP